MSDFSALNITEIDEASIAEVMPLEAGAHSHPWAEKTMEASLARHHCWGVFEEESLVGFGVFSIVVGEAELLDLVVDVKRQGRGLGRFFLNELLDRVDRLADRVFLEVRESNASAIALYQSADFVEVGVRHGYYPAASGREDAILMAREQGEFSFS